MIKRYRLLKECRIDKKLQPVGAEFDLKPQLGEWLVEQKFAELIVELQPPAAVALPAPALPAEVMMPDPFQSISPTRFGRCCGW